MLGETLALSAAMTWGVSVILFKQSEEISPQGLNLFKNVVAIILIVLTLPIVQVGIDWERSAEDWWRLCLSGVFGIAIADTLFFMALRRLGPSLLAIVECVYAPLIVLLSVVILDESLTMGFVVGGVLVVGGVAVAVCGPMGKHVDTGTAATLQARRAGIVIGVLGVVFMAVGIVIVKPALGRGHLVEITLIRLVAGVLGQCLWIAAVRSERSALTVWRPSRVWFTLLPAAFLGSYVSLLLWLGGFKWADASAASVLNQMATVFTIILARVFLKEKLTRPRVVGGLIAIGGALLVLLL